MTQATARAVHARVPAPRAVHRNPAAEVAGAIRRARRSDADMERAVAAAAAARRRAVAMTN
jgi:hypothetical protein